MRTATTRALPLIDAAGDEGPLPQADELEPYRQLSRDVLAAPLSLVMLRPEPDATAVDGASDAAVHPVLRPLIGEVIASGQSLALPALGPAPGGRSGSWPPTPVPRSFLGVPLHDGGPECVGCLAVADYTLRGWSNAEQHRLESLATLLTRELTLRRRAREHLVVEHLARVLGKAVENMQLGVTVTDLQGRIVYTNPADARMHGYEVAELVGQHARILGPPESGRALDLASMEEATSWTRETVNVRRDGSRFPVLLWSDRVTDAKGECIAVVTCCEDITERKRAEQTLRDVALRDPLTELPNRAYFLDRLTDAMRRNERSLEHGFAVLFLDLDRFKVVNDSLGHHVGDQMLIHVAERLRRCVRPADTVARFGGDEFAVLLEEVGSLLEATAVAERIQAELARPIHLHGYELFTSASVGIVMGAHSMEQPEYLWRSADMAMYRAKAAGTGQYEVFTRAMHADALARLQLETDLRRALERQEFELYYQPVVDLATGGIAGFEALLRWQHPLRGTVGPDEAIPIAEETGLILPLGEWVLGEAARQLGLWRGVAGSDLWIGVNLSSKQLSQANLLEQVQRVVHDAGIPPQALKLEITESAVVENTESASAVLSALKEFGVQLYMDDFGTGYSSLSYLHRLPLDAIKIDRSFVSRMQRGDKHEQLVESIVKLARSVRLRVVAEGVSAPEQLAILRELGCDLVQGYLFAPPLPRAEAEALLLRGAQW